jgi:cytoskeleton protein RodZ
MSAALKPGFGATLKLAREAQGLTAAEVAAKLKLGARQIEALEAEDLAQLPGDMFTRGFVRNYARLMDIDADSLILPVDPQSVPANPLTAPSEGVTFASPGLRRWVLLPILAFGFFVALVAVLYYWLRQGEETLVPAPAETATPATPPLAVVPPPAMNQAAPAAESPATPPPAPADAAAIGATPVPAGQPTATTSAPTTALPTQSPSTPPAPPPTVAQIPVKPAATTPAAATPPAMSNVADAAVSSAGNHHTLRFSSALNAWIQVIDGQGKRYSKLVRSGDNEIFVGTAPFKLVVGEAAQVRLSYDGHSIDLQPFIGQKVARLTLE